MGGTWRRRRLQICAENVLAGRPDLLQELEAVGCVIEQEGCLDRCTRCRRCAFALVSGRYLFAPSAEAFLEKMQRKDSARAARKR